MKLPKQGWTHKEDARALLEVLEAAGGRTRLVGGAVRDGLLGLALSDLDFATEFLPDEVSSRVKTIGLKVVPTGLAHGTVTVVAPTFHAEVTTLRRDVATDGRRATIAYTENWREDAARRDFTINAMNARVPELDVEDYFGGLADLQARRVRFIGDPLSRIAEDHLRILRFFRFHARFGQGMPDASGLAACTARANDLMALSRERISDELLKILALPDPVSAMRLMIERGIWRPVLPEFDSGGADRLAHLVAAEHAAGIDTDPLRRLAAFLQGDPDRAREVAARLRLSKRAGARLAKSVRRLPPGKLDFHVLAFEEGVDVAVDRLLLSGRGDDADLRRLARWEPPSPPFTGKDFIARGLAPGPEVSKAVQAFRSLWAANGFPDDPAALDRLARQAMEA